MPKDLETIEAEKLWEHYKTYEQFQCRWSQSLGELEATHQEVWNTENYLSRYAPTVFFGLYDLRDYIALWRHKGKAWVLWAGSDILNLKAGFVFNDGKLKLLSKIFRGNWWVLRILKKAEHWTENDTEKEALESLGIKVSGVCPSFLGDVNKFEVNYKWANPMNVYVSAGEGREREYGWTTVLNIAYALPDVNFYLYGSESWKKWYEENPAKQHKNIIMRGRVPKEVMNEEIKNFQVGLRLNEFDGFSEIMAKSVLWGQYQIGKVKHPHIPSYKNDMDLILKLNMLRHKKEPNLEVREWYRKNLNNFPWNERII